MTRVCMYSPTETESQWWHWLCAFPSKVGSLPSDPWLLLSMELLGLKQHEGVTHALHSMHSRARGDPSCLFNDSCSHLNHKPRHSDGLRDLLLNWISSALLSHYYMLAPFLQLPSFKMLGTGYWWNKGKQKGYNFGYINIFKTLMKK